MTIKLVLAHAHPSWLCISFPQPDLKYFGEQVFVSIRYMILFFGYSLQTTFGSRRIRVSETKERVGEQSSRLLWDWDWSLTLFCNYVMQFCAILWFSIVWSYGVGLESVWTLTAVSYERVFSGPISHVHTHTRAQTLAYSIFAIWSCILFLHL